MKINIGKDIEVKLRKKLPFFFFGDINKASSEVEKNIRYNLWNKIADDMSIIRITIEDTFKKGYEKKTNKKH